MVTRKPVERLPAVAGLPSFLRALRLDWSEPCPSAAWLVNDFYDNEWRIRTGDDSCATLSWHRKLANGLLLSSNGYNARSESSDATAKEHTAGYVASHDYRPSLNQLKRIVFYYRHPRISRRCGVTHFFQFFQWIMTLVDWVFLHEARFCPRLHLFERVDTVDLDHEFSRSGPRAEKPSFLNWNDG